MSRLQSALNRASDNVYLASVRAGMVAIVPLTIIGGLFMIVSYLPVPGWEARVAAYLPLLQVPVTATFGLLAVFACFAVAYELGKHLGQEAVVSASMATAVFLMMQIDVGNQALAMEGLGSRGLFTAILVAIVSVRVQKLFADRNLVIRMPVQVPDVVYQSFLSLVPLVFLFVVFWTIRFVLGIDVDGLVQAAFSPLVFALNTLPGILAYAFLVTMLWSIGINGDNAVDAVVAPVCVR
jgi:PTS system cellobiose-specific IIC component